MRRAHVGRRMKKIRKLLVANRSEIAIRVFRSAHELGIRTVAIYSHEDRFALHRFKADEAYQVGKPGEPIRAYLDIAGIVALARGARGRRDPPRLRLPLRESGLRPGLRRGRHHLRRPARRDPRTARRQGRPPARIAERGRRAGPARQRRSRCKPAPRPARWPQQLGYPVIVKAAHGRRRPRHARRRIGRRSSTTPSTRPGARPAPPSAVADVFLEKFIRRARHIEVQLLGDQHGNLVHLFERDCSVQRRHQKVVEIAPAPNLDPAVRQRHPATPPWRSAGPSRYDNAGTVEFLVDADTRRVLLHRGQPAHPGRAHRHRRGDRRRHRQEPDPDRPGLAAVRSRRSAWRSQSDDPHARLRLPVPRDDRGPGEQLHARLRPAQRTTARPAAWASASTPARPSPARSSRRSTIRCW